MLGWRLATPSPVPAPPLPAGRAAWAAQTGASQTCSLPSATASPSPTVGNSSSDGQPTGSSTWVATLPRGLRPGQHSYRLAPGRHHFPGAASRASRTPYPLQQTALLEPTPVGAVAAAVAAGGPPPAQVHAAPPPAASAEALPQAATACAATAAPEPEPGRAPGLAAAARAPPYKHVAATGCSLVPRQAKRRCSRRTGSRGSDVAQPVLAPWTETQGKPCRGLADCRQAAVGSPATYPNILTVPPSPPNGCRNSG